VEWRHAIILGLVEGITEYLPVSSTGHLIIVSALLGLDDPANPSQKTAIDAFNIVVQGGAILAVVGLYRARVVQMIRGLLGKDPAGFRLLVNLLVAFLPAAVVGLALHGWIEKHLFGPRAVVPALIVGGVYMILIEQWRRGRFGRGPTPGLGARGLGVDDMTISKSLFVGVLQCFALWPGTSRSVMTITGGIITGLRPAAAAEFSFLLGLPTLGAATAYSLYKNLTHAHDPGAAAQGNFFEVLGATSVVIGLITAALSAAVAIRWLVGFLNRSGLSPFGWYRILLGFCLIGLMAGGVLATR